MTVPAVLVEPSQSLATALDRAQDQTLYDWIIDELVDTLDIEKTLTRTLQRMVKAAPADDVRQALTWHLGTTRDRVDLLRAVVSDLDRVAVPAQYDTEHRASHGAHRPQEIDHESR